MITKEVRSDLGTDGKEVLAQGCVWPRSQPGPKSTSLRPFAGSLAEDCLGLVLMAVLPGTLARTLTVLKCPWRLLWLSLQSDVRLTVTWPHMAGLGQDSEGSLSVWMAWLSLGGLLAEEADDFDDTF